MQRGNGHHILPIQHRVLQEGCPNKCYPPWFFSMAPKPGTAEFKNAMGRCVVCLTYWEVNVKGEVVNIRGPKEDARGPNYRTEDKRGRR